jgi:D-lactate dehydrogenase (cytochrome)
MLLMEFHGSPASVQEQAATVQALAQDHGGHAFEWATTPEERTRLWTARHKAYFAALQMRPGCRCLSTDTCVPISRLAESINASVDEAEAAALPYWIVGHVGDGNFHLCVAFDPDDSGERAKAEALAKRISLRAIAMGGTCTGEHGIGVHKLEALVQEHGEAVELMRTIKRALDPCNIMNPGKTVPR